MKKRLSRRDFMRLGAGGVSLAALASPLLRLAWARADGTAPKNLFIFYTPHGFHRPSTISGGETNFTLGPAWAPLEEMRDEFLFLRNIGFPRSGPVADDHKQGMVKMLTGRAPSSDEKARGPSLDQFIASKLSAQLPQGAKPWKPWTHAVMEKWQPQNLWTRMSYEQVGENYVPVGPQLDPNAPINDNNSPFIVDDEVEKAKRDANRARIRRSLDYAKSQSQLIFDQQPQAVRAELTNIQDAYAQLRASNSGSAPGNCAPPNLGNVGDIYKRENFPNLMDKHFQVLTAGLACNATCVASLQFLTAASATEHDWITHQGSKLTGDIHVTAAHENHGSSPAEINRRDRFNAITSWYCKKYKELVSGLKTAGLLDSTMVVWLSELADGDFHDHLDSGIVVAGGGSAFRKGRFRRFSSPEPHTRLLQTFAQKMGVDATGFGDPDQSKGPFSDGEL